MDIAVRGRKVSALPPQSHPGNLVCYNHSDWTANKINPQSLKIFLSWTYQIGWPMNGRLNDDCLVLTLVFSFLEHFSRKAIKIFLKSFHLLLALSAFFLLGFTEPGGLIDEVKMTKKRRLNSKKSSPCECWHSRLINWILYLKVQCSIWCSKVQSLNRLCLNYVQHLFSMYDVCSIY